MPDINAPFVCQCGGTLFHRLKQYNATCCELETDPAAETGAVIECSECEQRYQQTTEWGWAPVPQFTTPIHRGSACRRLFRNARSANNRFFTVFIIPRLVGDCR